LSRGAETAIVNNALARPYKKNEGSRLLSYAYTEAKGMDSFIDAAILATAVVGSFGAAFMIQTAALHLILRAMKYR
jgi:hypothetical protein